MKYFSLIVFFSLISCNGQTINQKIKSITKTINDTILEKKEYDKNQNLVFEKHNQIDFGNENSIIFITAFVYDSINNKKYKYYANSNTDLELTIDSIDINSALRSEKKAIFREIGDKKKYRENLFKINSKDSFLTYFNSIDPTNTSFDYEYYYSDTIVTKIISQVKNDTIILETTKQQDDLLLEYSKVFLNKNGKKLKEITIGDYGKTIELIFNEKEQIIRQNEKGQYYKFFYENENLIKKEMYHGNSLAFKNEFFYKNGKLIKEIKHRITESKYFLKVPKIQTVLYHYEYY